MVIRRPIRRFRINVPGCIKHLRAESVPSQHTVYSTCSGILIRSLRYGTSAVIRQLFIFSIIRYTDQTEQFLPQLAGTIWEGSELPPNLDPPHPS